MSPKESFILPARISLRLCHKINRGFIPDIPRKIGMLQFILVLGELNQLLV